MTRKILLFLASLSCLRAWGQDLPELPEVVVTATRVDSSVIASPGFITVVSSREITESGARDLAEVVSGQSGVVVNDYGPAGASKTMSLRGSTSSQVLVLVDGVRLNSSVNGAVDLSSVPLEDIERVEIVRGGESSLYGTGAVGGVVNIITKKPGTPELSLTLTNAGFLPHAATNAALGTSAPATAVDLVDGQRAALSASGKLGPVGLSAGGSLTRAANAFTWDAGSGTWMRRDHAADVSGDGFFGLRTPLLGGELAGRGTYAAAATELPGTLSYPTPDTRQETLSASGALRFTTERFFTDALSFDLKGSYRYDQLAQVDPFYPSLHRTHSAAADLTQRLSIIPGLAAVYGGSASYELVNSSNMNGPKDRLSLAGFASVPATLFDILTLTPSVRYDSYSDFPAFLSYQLGAVLILSDSFSLKASGGAAYRVPLLQDLYWYGPDPFFPAYGNPNLKPETAWSGEAGLTVSTPALTLDAAVFARLVSDMIEWDFSQNPGTPVNIGKSFLPGAELHAKGKLLEHFSVGLDYAFIYGVLLQYGSSTYQISDGQRVPFVPLHNLGAELRYEDALFSAGAGVQYVGEKYTDAANSVSGRLDGYTLVNADFRFTPARGLSFSVAGKNLLGTVYQTQKGYPMPPLSIEAGAVIKL
jgi:vitamin B12 transporter